jgi:hypothetical protein
MMKSIRIEVVEFVNTWRHFLEQHIDYFENKRFHLFEPTYFRYLYSIVTITVFKQKFRPVWRLHTPVMLISEFVSVNLETWYDYKISFLNLHRYLMDVWIRFVCVLYMHLKAKIFSSWSNLGAPFR